MMEQIQEVSQPILQNWNNVNIDFNNPVYKLFKELGCDLASEITNKYDAFIIGLQFIAVCGFLYFFLKYMLKLMSHFLGGKF